MKGDRISDTYFELYDWYTAGHDLDPLQMGAGALVSIAATLKGIEEQLRSISGIMLQDGSDGKRN